MLLSKVLPVLPVSMTSIPLALRCQPSALSDASLNDTMLLVLPLEIMKP